MAEPAQTIQKPVITWRQKVIQAGAIVPKTWRRYRATVFQGYLLLAVAIFLVLAVLAHTVAYFTFDVTITREVQTFSAGWFAALMAFISWIGFAPQVNLITAIILLFLYLTGVRWEAVLTFLSVVGISALGFAIKLLVDRPRPSADLVHVLAQLKDYSFPSGHVLYYTTFFGFMLFLTYVLLRSSWLRFTLLGIFGALVSLVGLSRIYEGQHWASDVLAAYLLGSVWLAATVWVYRWGKPRFFVNQPIAKETGKDRAAS
jgi:undecaprenyl-diphosphatase